MKKLKKLLKGGVKKLINNAEFVAVEQACFKHRNRRKYLCVSLRQISNFLRVSPGLVGPKFPIIVSALSVVRHELEWYMVFNRNSSNTTNITPSLLNTGTFDIIELSPRGKVSSACPKLPPLRLRIGSTRSDRISRRRRLQVYVVFHQSFHMFSMMSHKRITRNIQTRMRRKL